MSLELREASGEDLDVVESLLGRYGLPTADVHDGAATFFLVETGTDVVGVGGLEVHDDVGLLRSVAVAERERGHGTAICEGLEGRAREAGVETLYLLTETAAGFFEGRGYEQVDRADAPPAIQATTEFSELCGDAAVCLRRRL